MTKEEALKWSELFKAFAEGKQIQYSANLKKWINIKLEEYDLHFDKVENYRIKPEPKYIPYTWDDWREFMGEEIVEKKDKHHYVIKGIENDQIKIYPIGFRIGVWILLESAFIGYTHLDGAQFGKLVEE